MLKHGKKINAPTAAKPRRSTTIECVFSLFAKNKICRNFQRGRQEPTSALKWEKTGMTLRLLTISGTILLSFAAKAKEDFGKMMSQNGKCDRLIVEGQEFDCVGKMIGTSYNSGRAGFYFVARNESVVTFSGMGTAQVKTDENTAIQPVDLIITGKGKRNQRFKAVGFCRFTNPYAGPSIVQCEGYTENGFFAGSFTSDGAEPKQIN